MTNRSWTLEDYVKRGRQYESRETGGLRERFVELWREFFRFDDTNEVERRDVEAELRLRDEDLPWSALENEYNSWKKIYTEGEAAARDEDDTAYREQMADLGKFLRQRTKKSS